MTTTRRRGAFAVDALAVGVPAALVGVVVPVLPIGLLIWLGYRAWCAWTGTSVGRWATGWRLARVDGEQPGAVGLVRLATVCSTVAAGVAAGALVVGALEPDSLLGWAAAIPAAAAAIGAVSVAGLVGVIGGHPPRIDRILELHPRRTCSAAENRPVTVDAAQA